jgi:septal ring factor EnvC (AmiA/AmiB activator)
LELDGHYVTMKFIPTQGEQGKNHIILIRDITKRKEAEDELELYMLHLEEKVTEQTKQYKKTNAELLLEIESRKELQEKLEQALGKVKQLSGFLPICSSCKKIRDDQGYWNQVEQFIQEHSEAEFSHGLCPECAQKIYPDLFDKDTEE